MPKILTASDLHLHHGLYHQLEQAVAKHKPDVLALVGDFLDGRFPRPPGLLSPSAAGWLLSNLPCQVVCVRGNHDDAEMPDFMDGWNQDRPPLLALHAEMVVVCGIHITGFPCWLGDECIYAEIAIQRPFRKGAGRNVTLDWLDAMINRHCPSLTRSLWLMHEAPVTGIASRIAVCDDWRPLIESRQPDVVVCGHDHSTPIVTGVWNVRHGRTWIINTGQAHSPESLLRYCLLEFYTNGDFQSATLYEGAHDLGTIVPKKTDYV